jgi:tight adherence protein B
VVTVAREVAIAVVTVAVGGAWLRPAVPARSTLVSRDEPTPGSHRIAAPRVRRRATRVDPAELAGWCDALARAVRGGATLHHAVQTVEPPVGVAWRLEPALLGLARGCSLRAALEGIERGSPDLDLVLVVLQACAEHGGPPAEPIDRAASALRQRAALAFERRTQSAQARMSAIVMTVLPGVLLALLLVTSGPTRTALTSGPGAASVLAGAAFNAAGWAWMRRLIAGRR